MRRPSRRTVGVVLLVLVAVLVGGFAWYVQPQPLLPEATASLASTPEVTSRRPTAASSGRRPRRLRHRADRLSRWQGPARGVWAARPGHRRRRLPRGHHADAVQPRGVRDRRGRRRHRGAPRGHDLGDGRPLARRLDGRAVRERQPRRDPRPRLLGRLRGDRPVRARPRRSSRSTARSTPAPPGCRAPRRVPACPPTPCSSRSRAATTSRWATTRASRTTRPRRSAARTSRRRSPRRR